MFSIDFITNLIKRYTTAIIVILIIAITASVTRWYYTGKIDKLNNQFNTYKLNQEIEKNAKIIKALEDVNKLRDENDKLNKDLKRIEDENYKKQTNLQKKNDYFRRTIADGSTRLYIDADCKGSRGGDSKEGNNTTGAVDNGEATKAVINPRDAETIISITNKGDKYKGQLEALQEWVEALLVKE